MFLVFDSSTRRAIAEIPSSYSEWNKFTCKQRDYARKNNPDLEDEPDDYCRVLIDDIITAIERMISEES